MTHSAYVTPQLDTAGAASVGPVQVFIDLTHLGRHVTGIERVSIEQFEKVDFAHADVTVVRANGLLSLIWCQQVWLPLLALLHPRAVFVFPGFPPSPLFVLIRNRVILYVHDLFLITRWGDLGFKAKAYMAGPFAFAAKRLKHFQVNSEKTAAELAPFMAPDAIVSLYRPGVRNVFELDPGDRAQRDGTPSPLALVALGTVEPRKNYGAALALLDALIASGRPAHLHIIGRDGWGVAKAALASHPNVTIHGYLAPIEVKAVLEAADLYVCTSHDEGLGLPLLEAQYAGLAVIAPDRAVFQEALGISALLIEPEEPRQSAAAILKLVAQPGWRARTTDAALANVARWNALAASDAASIRQIFAEGPWSRRSGSGIGPCAAKRAS
jgi:glycosyltransferase involved in cell wall biosynthesis